MTVPSATGKSKKKKHYFSACGPLSLRVCDHGMDCCVQFSSSSMYATMMSPFQMPPHTIHVPRTIWAELPHQTGGVLTGLWQKSDLKRIMAHYMVLQIAVHKMFSCQTRDLTTFHPKWISTILHLLNLAAPFVLEL